MGHYPVQAFAALEFSSRKDDAITRMQKIVFIAANDDVRWGGSEALWAAAAESLARRGIQVNVSVKDWGVPVKQVEHLRSLGCRIFLRRWPPSLTTRLARKIGLLPERTREHIRRVDAGADLIIVSQGGNIDSLPWMEDLRTSGCRYAVIAQAAAEQWWPDDDTAERLADCYEGACAAYFVSEANLALTRRQFVTPLHNARMIRNPFNVRYDARPVWPSDPSGGLSLACIGRLELRAKGQDLLVQVLDLPHWRDRDIHVSLFGDGANERSLRRWVDSLKLTKISFGGFLDDIEEIWRKHHALILPSRYEGMPLVLVEAMLCGRPAIVTDVAGHRELVRDGINGFLAKAPTVELLDEAMNRAWENRHRLKEMGEQAAIDVRKFVSPDPVEDFVRELMVLADGQPK